MKNKKVTLKRIIFLYYLILLIAILSFSYVIALFAIINNKEGLEPNLKSEKVFNIIKENTLKTDFSKWNESCDWNLLIVNNKNTIPENFKTNLKKYSDMDIDFRIIYYLNEMITDAYNQNVKLWVSSGYRSINKQDKLFKDKIQEFILNGYNESKAEALTLESIAKPGESEHHLGLAVDLNGVKDDFCYTNEYNWLVKNCINYGFILRYTNEKQDITGKKYEPWHFRYVGESHAKKMKEKNMCLEEYVSYLMDQNT